MTVFCYIIRCLMRSLMNMPLKKKYVKKSKLRKAIHMKHTLASFP